MKIDIMSILTALGIITASIVAGAFLRNIANNAYVEGLKKTADGWKTAYDQAVATNDRNIIQHKELIDRILQFEKDAKEYQKLNFSLQLELSQKDATIAEQGGKINVLEEKVKRLEHWEEVAALVVAEKRSS